MDELTHLVSALFSSVFLMFFLAVVGNLIGHISIKGVSLGAAGMLLAAVGYGLLAHLFPSFTLGGKTIELFSAAVRSDFSMISNLGAAVFIAAVGMTAGPDFFRSFSGKTLKYVLLGAVIIIVDVLLALALLRLDRCLSVELCVGLLTGALTSTPGLSAGREAVSGANADAITAGYGIAYLFGVIGVVLFVQLVPKLLRADLTAELRLLRAEKSSRSAPPTKGKRICVEARGFFPILLTVSLGCVIGAVRIPGLGFSFGTTGGTLISGLLLGHFGHFGSLDCRVEKQELNFLRSFGLVLFLTGSGVPAGISFLRYIQPAYFCYGIILTLTPMILGFLFARAVLKLDLLNALGAITGGMTSTPALGALIATAGSDDVAAAYAASYPTAMVLLVITSKLMVFLL